VTTQGTIALLDVSSSSYPERLCAAALQGLANRGGPRVFLDYGVYDDPEARRTNEAFIDERAWRGKYRDMLGDQDRLCLDYYEGAHGISARRVESLDALIAENRSLVSGRVVWDESMPDTANVTLMLAARDGLLPVTAGMADRAGTAGLPVAHDLRGRWAGRLELYRWALDELFPDCTEGSIACVEPEWRRPEFADYLVQNRIFTYSLSSGGSGAGGTILRLLAFGPAPLREAVFALGLDGPLRRLGLALAGSGSPEARLSNRIQRKTLARPYPTIFGWHTARDDELSFMLQLSSNGLRLVPAHLAANFSFHSRVAPLPAAGTAAAGPAVAAAPALLAGPAVAERKTEIDPDGVYVTFTLSDGDQLMMMNSGQLGNWRSPSRGAVPFNWEVQPLLAELAPALLQRYTRNAAPSDCLVAGPSGAGYVVPPLCPDLRSYMSETARLCAMAGLTVATSYVADPPRRVLRRLARYRGALAGFLCGYAVVGRAPQGIRDGCVFVANELPLASGIHDPAERLLEQVKARIEAPGPRPRFIAAHLFAYRAGIDDVARFVAGVSDERVHFVRADEFLAAARAHYSRHDREGGGA